MSDESRPKPPRSSNPDLGGAMREPSRSQIDQQLWQYLQSVERDKQEGNTIGNLRNEVYDVKMEVHEARRENRELATEQRLIIQRLDRHGRHIRELRKKVFHDDSDALMDTGTHQLEDLRKAYEQKKAEVEEHRENNKWWQRRKIEWFVAAVGGMAVLSLGGVGTMLWYILTHPLGGK